MPSKAPPRGRFITLEGPDGSGKTTNATFVAGLLTARGLAPLMTREPGGTAVGDRLRRVLLDPAAGLHPTAEVLLMFAARAQHVAETIAPALDAGRWVVSDRFTDSTFAYQGGGRGIADGDIERLAAFTHPHCWPDLTLCLDVPVEVSLERMRGRALDGFEAQDRGFYERVRAAYRRRADRDERCRLIDASRPLDLVQADIREVVEAYVGEVGP